MTISEIIKKHVASWDKKPCDINNGDCEEFADAILSDLHRLYDNLEKLSTNTYVCDRMPYHVWVRYKNKHYDAECPEGVDSMMELPFYIRVRTGSFSHHYKETFDRMRNRDSIPYISRPYNPEEKA